MKNEFKLHVDAKLENLSQIADFVTESARKFDLDERSIFQLQLATDEVASNIILHGYTHYTGQIHLSCWREDQKIKIRIEDRGEPFNPLLVETPNLNTSLEERSPGGLGIHFLKTLTSSVDYEFKNGKNRLTISKDLTKEE
jgi:serine/threonine-protein kinase RsbW